MGGILTTKKVSIGKFPANSEIVIPGLAGSADVKIGGGNDDEFDQNTAGTPSGWTSFGSPDTVDTTTAVSHLHLKSATNGGADSWKGIYKAAPSIPYTVSTKLTQVGIAGPWANYGQGGLIIMDGTTTNKLLASSIATNNGVKYRAFAYYSNWTTYGSAIDETAAMQLAPVYFKAVVHSATNIDYYISHDGLTWVLYDSAVNHLANATYVGIAMDPYGQTTELFCDWIRFS